jgi:hypothetical protein
MGTAVMAETHKAQEGILGGFDTHTSTKTSMGTLQAR